MNVLTVRCSLLQYAWPRTTYVLADRCLDAIKTENLLEQTSHIVTHSASFGTFVNMMFCMKYKKSPTDLHGQVIEMIWGQVYDSPVWGDFKHFNSLFATAVTNNVIAHRLISTGLGFYFKLASAYTMKIIHEAYNDYYEDILPVPTLVFFCGDDTLSDVRCMLEAVDGWHRNQGIDVTLKLWETSLHSAHLKQHRQEYLQTVYRFLDKIDM